MSVYERLGWMTVFLFRFPDTLATSKTSKTRNLYSKLLSAFVNWKFWGDYGGNYSGNVGPSHNLLITFISRTLLFFQHDTRYPYTFSYFIIIIILYNNGIHLSSDRFSMSVCQVSKGAQGSSPCQGRQISRPVLPSCMRL